VGFDYDNCHRRDSHDFFLLYDDSSHGVSLNRPGGAKQVEGNPRNQPGKSLVPTPADML
jgi:hypothetical protein